MVVCLEQCADLHMAQLMPLPLTVSCFSKIQIGFTFLVPAHLGSPGKRAVKWVCACVLYSCKILCSFQVFKKQFISYVHMTSVKAVSLVYFIRLQRCMPCRMLLYVGLCSFVCKVSHCQINGPAVAAMEKD